VSNGSVNVYNLKINRVIADNGANSDFQYDWDSPSDGWTDLPVNLTVRGSGSNNPAWSVFRNNLYAYEFVGTPDGSLKEIWGEIHVPHSHAVGTGIYFHVHWAPNSASPSGNIKFNFEYTYANSGSVYPASSVVSVVQAMPAQYTHTITEIASPVLAGRLEVDGLVLVRLYRDPADAQDTSTDSAFIFNVDCHMNVNKWGTKYRNKDIGGSFYG
jgi:hypothetical protein